MKKALIGIGMLAVACMVCGPAFAALVATGDGVPHSPLTDSTSCNNFTGVSGTPPANTFSGLMATYGAASNASLPSFSLGSGSNYDPAVTFPTPGNYDFCAAFDTAACSVGVLASFSTDIVGYMNLFLCTTDINGPIDTNLSIPVTGNGIPDGEFELGLIAAILNNTYTLDPTKTGGKTNADVAAAYQANFQFFKQLVLQAISAIPVNGSNLDGRTLLPGLAPYLVPGLVSILTGYATEGDDQSMLALDTLLGLLGQLGITPPSGGVAAHTTGFKNIFGPEGDADGDGFTNRQEYNYFKNNADPGKTPAFTVVKAQLTAAVTPPATIPAVLVLSSGTYEEGTTLTLTAVAKNTTGALAYAWSKDGGPTIGTAQQLVIPVLALTDAGKYSVTASSTQDGSILSNTVTVVVVAAGTLPIAGGLGLALLAGACALGGVGSIRRRK